MDVRLRPGLKISTYRALFADVNTADWTLTKTMRNLRNLACKLLCRLIRL